METNDPISFDLLAASNAHTNNWRNLDSTSAGSTSLAALRLCNKPLSISRFFDVLVSMLMILIIAPLAVLIAILIRLDSAGSVIYTQERLGLRGRPFMLFKFRSMYVNAEAGGPAWARVRDDRVTRVGRLLRLTRVDELPQLWNVLRGEMALVGPRPERPYFAEQLTRYLPQFPDRLVVKPGITGWAQVNLPYASSVEDARAKLAYDLYFINNRGFRLTLIIIARTFGVMVSKGGR